MPAVWVGLLCTLATALGFGVLFHHADVSVSAQVINLASSLVTGAFGAAAGHAAGRASATKITGGPVTVNQNDPSTPQEPQA